MPTLFKNLSYTLILASVLLGCETLPPQPDKTAVYHTANGTTTEADTLWENFIDKCYYDDSITSAEFYPGNNKTVTWQTY